MKLLAGLCLIALTLPSFAADRDIYDLMYLPQAGTFFGRTTGTIISGEIKGGGAPDGIDVDFDGDISGYGFRQEFGYSLTDRFMLQIGADYQNVRSSSEVTVAGLGEFESKNTTKGLSDPSIIARFRALDEDFLFDLYGGMVIGTGDSETDGDKANNKQGGNSLILGTEFGAKQDNLQYAFNFQLKHNFEATNKDKDEDGSLTTKADAHNEIQFGASIQPRLTENLFLSGFATVSFTDEYDDNQEGTTASQTVYSLGAELRLALAESVMLFGGATYNKVNTNSGYLDDYHIWFFQGGALYQF
jgi:hypothetical protein